MRVAEINAITCTQYPVLGFLYVRASVGTIIVNCPTCESEFTLSRNCTHKNNTTEPPASNTIANIISCNSHAG